MSTPETLIRPLVDADIEAWLELLRDWPFADDRTGDEFFARPIEEDPRWHPSQVFGAFVAEQMVGCCQVFPRQMLLAGEHVPVAGIGTVFVRSADRGRGIASALLEAALDQAAHDGQELAMLWAGRFDLYESLGFQRWGPATQVWVFDPAQARSLGATIRLEKFVVEEHLHEVRALHRDYGSDRHGSLARDEDSWRASLALSGNPVEEFVIVKDAGSELVVAYLRGCLMDGAWQVLEWAYAPGFAGALAQLVVATARTVDQHQMRAPTTADPDLERALAAVGVRAQEVEGGCPEWMLRSVDSRRLAARFGLSSSDDLVRILLPPSAFHFWMSDRF